MQDCLGKIQSLTESKYSISLSLTQDLNLISYKCFLLFIEKAD